MPNYQNRILLHLLDNTPENNLIKKILKSPLGLAYDLINALFEDKLGDKEQELDKIKNFAAGITRAYTFSKNYTLANYYPYMFSFQQYFHSSFRARQGKVLEEMIKSVLFKYANCDNVPEKVQEMQEILKQSFGVAIPNLDIDVMGQKTNKIILVQLRSRDDTGGTTAKGSLVELLRGLLKLGKEPKHKILYLICVWDERDAQQKNTTIEKIYASLQDFIKDKKTFQNSIVNGYDLTPNICLKMSYGTTEMQQSIFEWSESKDNKVLQSIKEIVTLVENWDDLWLTYSIANLELESQKLKKISNITLLNEKWETLNLTFNFDSYDLLMESINEATQKITPIWAENSIPLESLADKIHYIRDLILLKACYQKNNKK